MIASVLVLLDYSFKFLKKSQLVQSLFGSCSSSSLASPFKFGIPPIEADAYVCPDNGVKFRPPVYHQRYNVISRIFEEKKLHGGCKKIIDFGCAEIALFNYVKNCVGVEEYLAVDIDEELLNRYACRVNPLPFDYIGTGSRCCPFIVQVLCGSVADPDVRLLGADVVVAIELIEHLYPEALEDLPYNIFGVIQPDLAVFTTPNSDFNVLFTDLIGFRHDDHKFEWSRDQFCCWADNLVVRYPNYEVEVGGVGPGPPGSEHLGCSTQIAVFFRKGERTNLDDVKFEEIYKLVRKVEYPYSDPTELFESNVKYYSDNFIRLSIESENFLAIDDEEHQIPFAKVVEYVNEKVQCTEADVRSLLGSNWKIERRGEADFIVVSFYDDQNGWSVSSQASSLVLSSLSGSEDFCLQVGVGGGESDWDLDEPICGDAINPEENCEMSKEDPKCPEPGVDQDVDEVLVPLLSQPLVVEDGQAVARAEDDALPVPLRNINQEDPNVIPLAKCQSLEQINQSRNKNKPFRFSLNMEKNESDNGEIVNSASSESKDRDKSVPSFSESFGLRLEDSCSQSKAADSGYPNSVGQDMDMDLTPEQVDEIITETESSFDGDDDSISGDEIDGQEARQPNQLELVHQAPVIRFLDNVENGDVANNNRDGEGNNMEDNRIVGDALEFIQHVIRQEEEELQNPNIAAARAPHYPEVESDEDVISNTVDGSSQADSTFAVLDDDTVSHGLLETNIALVLGADPSPSPPRTPFNTRNPSVDHLAEDFDLPSNRFPSWLCNIFVDDGEPPNADIHIGNTAFEDHELPRPAMAVTFNSETSIEHYVPGDMMGGGEPNFSLSFNSEASMEQVASTSVWGSGEPGY